VVRAKDKDLLGGSLVNQVKSILGTCVSMGVTVDGKDARVVQKELGQGLYADKLQ
ncbi:MAG: 50S ribosomal protein L11, partial [Candidatus Hermodarchaeota archaeon]|nr:50S ribosomal protein L11 [Candidatus Hermodarchaeota archaeon]